MEAGIVVEQGAKAKTFDPSHDPLTELLMPSVPEMDQDRLIDLLKERAGTATSD